MKSFLEFSKEQKKKQEISFFPGRYQPFTKAHGELLLKSKYPALIGVIRGKKTSLDKDRNPFSEKLQLEIISQATNENEKIADIIVLESMNLDFIIDELRESGFEIKELHCGEDRVKAYKRMAKVYGKEKGANIKVIAMERDDEDISATKVREALRKNDFKTVKEMMTNITRDLYRQMRKEISSGS